MSHRVPPAALRLQSREVGEHPFDTLRQHDDVLRRVVRFDTPGDDARARHVVRMRIGIELAGVAAEQLAQRLRRRRVVAAEDARTEGEVARAYPADLGGVDSGHGDGLRPEHTCRVC